MLIEKAKMYVTTHRHCIVMPVRTGTRLVAINVTHVIHDYASLKYRSVLCSDRGDKTKQREENILGYLRNMRIDVIMSN